MSDADTLLSRAQAALDLGRHAEAAGFASQAVAKEPDNHHGHVMLAWCLLGDDNAEALASAQRAIALSPNSSSGFDVAAIAAGRVGQKKQAIEFAHRYVEMEPNRARAHRRLAETLAYYAKRKEIGNRAYDAALEAIKLDPDNAANWNAMGTVYWNLHDDKKNARLSYEKALEIDPLNSTAKSHLAGSIEDSGDKASALALVQSIIVLDPTDSYAREQLDTIVVGFLSDLLWLMLFFSFVAAIIVSIVFGT